jgi:hypothetical protein
LRFNPGVDDPKSNIHPFEFKLSKNGIYEFNFGDTLIQKFNYHRYQKIFEDHKK